MLDLLGGGGVDDILRRLGNVETDVSELRAEVSAISAAIPHLATAASVSELRSEVAAISAVIPHLATAASVSEIQAVIPHLATKADLKAEMGKVETRVASMEAAIIKWIIGTVLTTAGGGVLHSEVRALIEAEAASSRARSGTVNHTNVQHQCASEDRDRRRELDVIDRCRRAVAPFGLETAG